MKGFFKRLLAPAVFMMARGHATIQNISLASYAGMVPPVPSSANEAFAKCVVTDGQVKSGAVLQKLGEELGSLIAKAAELYDMDEMKAIQDRYGSDEAQATIEGISMEERIAFGMNLQKQLGMGTQGTQENLLMVEALKLNKELIDFDGKQKINYRWGALQSKLN